MYDEMYITIPVGALERPIAYHRIFRRITGSTVAAVFLSQAWYWTPRTTHEDGWFYKTQADWEEETGLSRREQETARKNLRELDLLEEERRGIPAQLWYRVDVGQLSAQISRAIKNGGNVHTGMAEPAKPDSANPPIIHTENTAETTTENTLSADAENDADEAARDRARIVIHGFYDFYNAYPRKEGRQSALKAWEKAARSGKITAENVEKIIEAIRKQAANNFKFRDKQYIPLASTWINGERWDDEIIPPQQAGTNGDRPKPRYYEANGSYTAEGLAAKARGEI